MEVLKKIRESLNMSQSEVSDKLGYSNAQMISNIERGVCFPPPKTLKKMCDIYSTDYQYMANMLIDDKCRKYREKLKKNYKL